MGTTLYVEFSDGTRHKITNVSVDELQEHQQLYVVKANGCVFNLPLVNIKSWSTDGYFTEEE